MSHESNDTVKQHNQLQHRYVMMARRRHSRGEKSHRPRDQMGSMTDSMPCEQALRQDLVNLQTSRVRDDAGGNPLAVAVRCQRSRLTLAHQRAVRM